MYRYSAEEAAAISANGLFANTPIDSNDSPAGNNQQYCSVMNTLAIAHKRDPDYGCLVCNTLLLCVRYSFVKAKNATMACNTIGLTCLTRYKLLFLSRLALPSCLPFYFLFIISFQMSNGQFTTSLPPVSVTY